MKMTITEGKGFQITFDNGILVSVQFGCGNYCENYYKHLEPDWFYGKERQERMWSSKDAEIAVWDTKKNDKWITDDIFKLAGLGGIGCDDVAANVNTEQLVKVLRTASRWHKWRKVKNFLLKYKIIR